MDGTTDYELYIDPSEYQSEVHVARSMSRKTCKAMVKVLAEAPAQQAVWTREMAKEVACWKKKANNKKVVLPPPAQNLLGDLPPSRDSTTIRSLSPMIAEPRNYHIYVEMFKRRVPNWQTYLDPFYDSLAELEEVLRQDEFPESEDESDELWQGFH